MEKDPGDIHEGVQDHPDHKLLSPEDQELLRGLVELLGKTSEACARGVELIRDRLRKPLPKKKTLRARFLYELGCLLADLGTEARDQAAIREALDLFENLEGKHLDDSAVYNYNRANALKSLSDFHWLASKRYDLEGVALLTEAKDMYWRAVRDLGARRDFWPELWVNLANALDQSCRISEALYWYDAALRIDPSHGMAHGNRAQSLGTLRWLTDQFSINLLAQAVQGFHKGLEAPDLQQAARSLWTSSLEAVSTALKDLGELNVEDVELEMQFEEELAEHSDYRRFCIGHGLTLCEHGLYCRCIGARRDDLSIVKSASPIAGDFVPRMEFLLNRLKAEFAWSRALYFQGVGGGCEDDAWNLEPYESTFSELEDKESVGLRPEMLRTSLRLCFGILDRIAFGVCDVLEIETFGRPLNFTTFWRDKGLKKERREERWKKLNELCTPSLVALYSQATDLTIERGEWGHFKEWRNALEHRLLFLTEDDQESVPTLHGVRVGFPEEVRVPISKFRGECLHILRFTASAIFNFAFFVRQLSLREDRKGPAITVTLDKKPVGPE